MGEPNSKLPLNLSLALFCPTSSVEGSATVFYVQPLLYGRVYRASLILTGAQLFLAFAKVLFGMEYISMYKMDENIRCIPIKIPIDKLYELIHDGAKEEGSSISQVTGATTTETAAITTTTTEAPLVIGLTVSADYSTAPFAPASYFVFPFFAISGIRGSLPLLILILLDTIFVRAVVPPEATGAKPIQKPQQ
ncbi:MAG: hypothetical protein Q8912_14460 [Bacillota bacterium]|nr:hypothetical protein [Bacillota bacterium]MDP4160215.1 hypothetical protein [Bacillota bacterium]